MSHDELCLSHAALNHIVKSVFETMLHLETNICEEASPPEQRHHITAAVQLTGECNASVVVECADDDACRLAARFLAATAPVPMSDVVWDLLGELANMIGGNLKGVLNKGLRLSAPVVTEGGAHNPHAGNGYALCQRRAFRSADGVLWVSVFAGPGQTSTV